MWLHLFQTGSIRRKVILTYKNCALCNYSSLLHHVSKKQIVLKNFNFLQRFNRKQTKTIIRLVSTKNTSSQKELRRLLKVAQSQKWKLTGAVLLLLVSSSVTMVVPFCVGKLIDMMSSKDTDMKENLVKFCRILIAVFIVGALANFGRVYLISISSQHITNSLRKKAYGSILCQEAAFFDSTKTGELINRLSSDTATVGFSITNNISDGLRYSFSFIGASCLMVYTSPILACLGLMMVAPVAVLAALWGKTLKGYSQKVQNALAKASEISEEKISNIRTVQSFAKLKVENQLYHSKIENVLRLASKEALWRAGFFGLTGFSGNLIILSVLYHGGFMMSENQITIGNLSSFLLYAAYVGISIGGLSSFYTELMRGLGASTRLWELIERKPLISYEGGITFPNFSGYIKFDSVSFSFPTRPSSTVLSDFDLSIPAGTVCALVGSSGCGKSTVSTLLLRLYDCQKGIISVDGHNIKSLDVQWLRKNIGLVSQDPVLFSYSIRENVLYGAEREVDESAVEDALDKANALGFVKAFPNGLDTVVGERGIMLSGGQRQRIAIARALLKNPRILILDEATSALDVQSEFVVQKALQELMGNRTTLIIAHRLSTVKDADVIVVLDKGTIVERGSYEELLSNKGPFYRLIQLQSLKTM